MRVILNRMKEMNFIKLLLKSLNLREKLQHHFYNANCKLDIIVARIIDMMESDGIVSKANHVGKRDVLK